jgi:hypothetical protein
MGYPSSEFSAKFIQRYKIYVPGGSRPTPGSFFPLKAYLADTIAFRNGLLQIKGATEALRYAPVAPHGEIAEMRHFLYGTTLLLPCVDQWTVMKINIEIAVGYASYFHFKNEPSRQPEKFFSQGFQAWFSGFGVYCGFGYSTALKKSASADGIRHKGFRGKAFLLRLIAQKIEPQSPMFKQIP